MYDYHLQYISATKHQQNTQYYTCKRANFDAQNKILTCTIYQFKKANFEMTQTPDAHM